VIHYDTNANINVNGRMESVSGLERGDVVEVRVARDSNGSAYWAQSMVLVRNSRY
jgi:(p)ppGpp synthase/HD superfamily hydrolase